MNKKEIWSLPYGIIHYLREHQGSPEDYYHKELLNFKSDFKRLPKSKAKFLYRGMDLDSADFLKLLKGETLKPIKKMESWTTNQDVARGFGQFVFKKAIPAKDQVADLNALGNHIEEFTYDHENEVVCLGQVLKLEHLLMHDKDYVAELFEDLVTDQLYVQFNGPTNGANEASIQVDKVTTAGSRVDLKITAFRIVSWDTHQRKEVKLSITMNKGKIENLSEHKKTIKDKLGSTKVVTPTKTVQQDDVVKYLKKLNPAKRKALLKKVV